MDDELDAEEPGPDESWPDQSDEIDEIDEMDPGPESPDEDPDMDHDADEAEPDIDTDVDGTHSPITKVRAEASIFDGGDVGSRGKIIALVAAIVLVSAVAGFFIARSAENTDLQLVEGSVQESLTPDCFWTITYEIENRSDDTVVMIDTKVFTGNGDLAVTQAARDIVLEAGQRTPNLIQYYVDGCPSDPADIDHGSLDIINTSLGGSQRTTRLEF